MVPKTFRLANRKWRVLFKKIKDNGRCFPDRAEIHLNRALKKTPELLAHTLEHELNHALFSTHGIHVDHHDERLIDGLAALRRQFEQTRRRQW
jgi:predicted SprT family Zn-dependent metalloprotease